jgi:cobalt-zinc-cadmium efflux system outer membrane protein
MNAKYHLILICYISCWFFGLIPAAFSESLFLPEDHIPAAMDQTIPSTLTLERAIEAALERNPDLLAFKFNIRLADAEKLQASFFPNPEVGFEYENFDEPEKTLTIGYLLELGGKRRLRMDMAEASAELALLEFDAARIEIVYETARAFIDVLVAQETLRIATDKEKVADRVYETARERVQAGRVSPMEQATAEIKRNHARLEVRQAEDELLIARTSLAAMWGGSATDFKSADGLLDRIQPVPSFDALVAVMDDSPAIKAKLSEIKIADRGIDLEKRKRIPDLTFSGGVKKVDGSDDLIYIAGLSLPIPLFDRNQAAVGRAAAERDRRKGALAAEKNRLSKDLKIAYQRLTTAHQQVTVIKTDILPSAHGVLDGIAEGYQEGEFSLIDMLEAWNTLYESHESYVQWLGQYHHATIDLETLLGRDLPRPDMN